MRHHIQGLGLLVLLAVVVWGTAQLAAPTLGGSINAIEDPESSEDVVVLATDNNGLVTEDTPLTEEEIKTLQFALTIAGFDTKGVDGALGGNTTAAADAARGEFGLDPNSTNRALLDHLSAMAQDANDAETESGTSTDG